MVPKIVLRTGTHFNIINHNVIKWNTSISQSIGLRFHQVLASVNPVTLEKMRTSLNFLDSQIEHSVVGSKMKLLSLRTNAQFSVNHTKGNLHSINLFS